MGMDMLGSLPILYSFLYLRCVRFQRPCHELSCT